MQFSVTFRQMDGTDALRDYAHDRVQRIRKYLPDPIAVHVTMGTERHNHLVDINVQLHNGLSIAGHETTENMYSSIDLALAKIERQVRRYKEKLRHHKGKVGLEPVAWSHSVLSEQAERLQQQEEAAAAAHLQNDAAARAASDADHVVMKTEKFVADPLSVPAAIMQLNLTDRQFLVFQNEDSLRVNVVYRRDDGSYGLIDTGAGNGEDPLA
jgi:putative sigma-54 modulation protein